MPAIVKQKPGPAPKAGGVVGRIGSIQFDQNDGIQIMLYGKSGSGKTTFWGTFPGPILAVICSGGSRPGELRSLNTAEYRKKVQQVTLEKGEELRELIAYQRQSNKYLTIVLDHVTGFQDLVLRDVLGLQELPAQKSFGMATRQQYGTCTLQCKEMLRSLLSLTCNIVIIGQERVFKAREGDDDDDTTVISTDVDMLAPTVGVATTPSLAGWLNYSVDYVCQMYKRPKVITENVVVNGTSVPMKRRASGVDYCLRTEPHDIYTTKFRMPRGKPLPECIVDPSYAKVMEIIQGS